MRIFVVLAILGLVVAGCGQPEEAPLLEPTPGETEDTATVELLETDPEAQDAPQLGEPGAETPMEPGEPEPGAVVETDGKPATLDLPENFPEVVHIWPQMQVDEVQELNPDIDQYQVQGSVAANPEEVTQYYVSYFRENGWEEDMVMVQETNAVVSFHKDGILQYVEAEVGGIGSNVVITTGQM